MKKSKIFLIGLLSLLVGFGKVEAAARISTNASSVYLGNTINVSVTVSQVASWEIHIKVSGAASASNCKDLDFVDVSSNTKNTTRTYTTTCRPTKTGKVTFSLEGNTTDENEDKTIISGTKTVSVINKPAPKPYNGGGIVIPKSSVNYLKSLEVEGKQISPKFDKETSEYTIELESETTSINIKAIAAHNKAIITGMGKKKVSEGVNNFNIVVTAENGSKRTYKIKATVQEKEPIIVNIDNREYTVIRKREQLIGASAFYKESTVKINDEEIPAYFGEVTGYTLVGLKDSEGNINLYTYNDDDNSYKLYHEFNFSKPVFYPKEVDDKLIPDGYSKFTTTINSIEVPCYKMNKDDQFVLLYGLNVENNEEGFYVYDPFENTLQRYNDKIIETANEKIMMLSTFVIGLLGIIIIILLAAAIQGSANKRKSNLLNYSENKIDKKEAKEKNKAAKLLKKELKRKEHSENKKSKKNKEILDDTNIIDISNINIKK